MEISEYTNRCKEMIKQFGYMIQGVGAGENTPAYAYTIGRELQGKSDFIILNLINQSLINTVIEKFDEMVSTNSSINYQTSLIVILDSFKVNEESARFKLIKIDPVKHKQLCLGCWNFSLGVTEPVGLYQIMYPDDKNILQDEEGFNELHRQPDLSV